MAAMDVGMPLDLLQVLIGVGYCSVILAWLWIIRAGKGQGES
jgi:hypothetical protein